MEALTLLEQARMAGLQVTTDGELLIVRGPKRAEPLARQLLARKPEVLALLRDLPAHVGRHGPSCPRCGDTWQWPVVGGFWVCAWCFVQDQRTAPRFADDGTVISSGLGA